MTKSLAEHEERQPASANRAGVPAQTIGRFQLLRQIGRGAQGNVFLATDPRLGRTVAIKTLTMRGGITASAVEALLQEARMASRLSHPNLVPVYEADLEGGSPYVVFEYVEGRSLTEILRTEGMMPTARAVITMSQILAGVAHAHSKGLLHGDITPAFARCTISSMRGSISGRLWEGAFNVSLRTRWITVNSSPFSTARLPVSIS